MKEIVERIGVCQSKQMGAPALFHRVKIKLSRKYRVWPVAGDDRSELLDPSEFTDKYENELSFKPKSPR
jgi:hypothetical protein